jgi:imidazole glycerol-phosphate synthase subunit HisH
LRVAVLDHGMGNIRSVSKALETAGADVVVTADLDEIHRAGALCVPGQGIFGRCMESIQKIGAGDLITSWVGSGRPFLGICLGMQVLFDYSEESGGGKGLGIVGGTVTRLPNKVPVPHIGWNTVNDTYFYFDHSYAAHPSSQDTVKGWCEHGDRFAAWIQDGPLLAVQFHPEKSGKSGIALLKEWVENT